MSEKCKIEVTMNAELVEELKKVCEEMGLTVDAAFSVYAKKVVRDRCIPFQITANPTMIPPTAVWD